MNTQGPLFIETVRWSAGRYRLSDLHAMRMARTSPAIRKLVEGGLDRYLPPVPVDLQGATLKCRLTYDTEIRCIELEPYTPKIIRSLRMVEDNTIDYHLKYADRSRLNALAALRGEADDIIIVRNGLIADTSYANLVFRAADALLTPSTPLLRGVMITHLLADGIIKEAPLTPADLLPGNRYGITHAMPVNAMLPPGAVPPIHISQILMD